MSEKLSDRFFGKKKLTQQIYEKIKSGSVKIGKIYENFEESTLRGKLFIQFLQNLIKFAQENKFSFNKLSSFFQIGAQVFIKSSQLRKTKDQSLQYFNQLIVRHRPPISVHIFNLEDIKLINQYWHSTFLRYYQQYKQLYISIINKNVKALKTVITDPKHVPLKVQQTVAAENVAALIASLKL